MTGSSRQTDVVIIGAGIAGAALACALRDSRLDVVVLEKSAAPLDTARGDHLQPRTAEILERWGVLTDFFAAGAEKRLGSVWYDADGEPVLRSSVAELDVPHPYYLFLNHEAIGATMLDAALASPTVDLVRPIRNWWLDEEGQDATHIRVAPEEGEEFRLAARVIVGADGRSSRTRRQFGFDAQTHRYERPIVVMFGRDRRRNPDNELAAHLNAKQMVAVIPRTGGGCKIGVPVDQSNVASWRKADGEELARRLHALAPGVELDDVTLSDIYPPVYLRAGTWTRGRTVLIGDAVHAMHPARSQGMNAAIRCVDALARAMIEGMSDGTRVDALLAEYERQLKPGIDAMLEKNHEHGLAMDRSGAEDYAATCAALRAVQADPATLRAFTMNAAGYAPAVPAR